MIDRKSNNHVTLMIRHAATRNTLFLYTFRYVIYHEFSPICREVKKKLFPQNINKTWFLWYKLFLLIVVKRKVF